MLLLKPDIPSTVQLGTLFAFMRSIASPAQEKHALCNSNQSAFEQAYCDLAGTQEAHWDTYSSCHARSVQALEAEEVIRKQVSLAEQLGLCRAASAWNVIWNLLWPSTNPNASHEALPMVPKVDIFICHSWSCPAGMKILVLCHYFNLSLAMVSAIIACLLASLGLILQMGSLRDVGRESYAVLWSAFVLWPSAVFLLMYFFGHLFRRSTVWLDRLCVNQANLRLKAQTLQVIPAFVSQASEMLVVWDQTLLQKAWCSYEMAVRAKASGFTSSFLVPIWAPIWSLFWVGFLIILSWCLLDGVDPLSSLNFSSMFIYYFGPPYTYVVSAPCSALFCIWKLEQHKALLDQMDCFDLRKATCTLETDRVFIRRQVLRLFDDARRCGTEPADPLLPSGASGGEPGEGEVGEVGEVKEEVLEEFNDYVRGPLREGVVKSLGSHEDISLELLMVMSLPLIFLGVLNVLTCEGRLDCEAAVSTLGCPGFSFIVRATLAGIYLVFWPLNGVIFWPLTLRASHLAVRAAAGPLAQFLLASLSCGGVLILWGLWQGASATMFLLGSKNLDRFYLSAVAAGVMLEIWLLWHLTKHNWMEQQSSKTSRRSGAACCVSSVFWAL
eukprot:g29219.t2